jgi:16S rRNA (cytosine967-C5)-methyltransferase
MADGKLKSARAVAIEVLNRCDPKSNYAGSILDRVLHETSQRQRATDLVFGTLRNRGAIDVVISTFSGRPVERIQGRLLNIIRVGVYELLYSPATETYAIVNEAAESTKAVAGNRQTGFVNAVLRQVIRHIGNRQVPLLQANAERTVPQTPSAGCEFDTGFLPDRETHPAEYLSVAFSLPAWLVAGWLDEFGEESTRRICFASNRRPSIYIRPNRLRTTTATLAEKLGQVGIDLEIVPNVTPAEAGVQKSGNMKDTEAVDSCFHRNDNLGHSMIRIASPRELVQLPGFAEGEFTVQDITASRAVKLLDPQPGWTILDLCAAPGTKTTQLAEATGDSATIIATDIDRRRLEMVKENIARLGIKSVKVVPYEEVFNPKFEIRDSKFDAVLLDVPCSNTGVLAKRVEARYRISPEAIGALVKIQAELLGTAALMLKPHGKICYSTCSIQKAENAELVQDFLKENPAFSLESEKLTLPSAEALECDGGYTAILVQAQK